MMNYPGASFPHQSITYTRGATKAQALLNRLRDIEEETPALSPEETAKSLAHLNINLRSARRAFEANSRALDTIDSLINQVF